MMRWTRGWVWGAVVLSLCSFSAGGVAAQTTGDVVVIGEVTNGTSGGTIPAGAPVTLQLFGGAEWTNTYTSTLDADGTFRFADLEAEAGNDFLAHIVYQDVSYYSEPANLDGEAVADILIYEATDDLSLVQVDQAHLFIVPTGDRLQISEYYLIGNTGEGTYIGAGQGDGDERTTVAFSVPPAAMGLIFDGPGLGERFIGDPTSFADSLPVPPGTATIEVDFAYELAYEEGLVLTRELNVPVKSVVIIVNGSEIGLAGSGVEFAGMMDTQMGPAASYTAGPYTAGVPLVLRFVPQDSAVAAPVEAPTPVEASGPPQRDPVSETLIGSVALVVAAFVAYQVWQAQPTLPMPEAARDTVADIIALDERHASGDLPDRDYEQQRSALRRKIRSDLPRGR
ncbi:MAG: hypothetical protein MUQ30_12580 [Anaerolineae bacterium]|nr:hypothetical protein [Anaerolineae bacterium]